MIKLPHLYASDFSAKQIALVENAGRYVAYRRYGWTLCA